jgi:hypothetical protein
MEIWNNKMVTLSGPEKSRTVEVSEYVVSKNFLDAPAFDWWVPYVIKKPICIIADVTKIYHKRTQQLGIEVPKSREDCVILDKENGNTLWQDTVRKEMKNFRIAFQILNGDEAVPPTYQEICCHMIFDVNMDDFCRNAQFIVRGHTTYTPHAMTYASVVSRESFRIAFTLADMNDLDINMADIENAQLPAPITEKIWTVLGPGFGDDAGKRACIVRALYGLKSAGAAFRNHPAEGMIQLGCNPCHAD